MAINLVRNGKIIGGTHGVEELITYLNNKMDAFRGEVNKTLSKAHSLELISFDTIINYIINEDIKELYTSLEKALDVATLLPCEFEPKSNILYVFRMSSADIKTYYNTLIEQVGELLVAENIQLPVMLSERYSSGIYGLIENNVFQLSNDFWSNPYNIEAIMNLINTAPTKKCSITAHLSNIKNEDTLKICIIDWNDSVTDVDVLDYKTTNTTTLSSYHVIQDEKGFGYNEDSLIDISVYVKDYNIPSKAITITANTTLPSNDNINAIYDLTIKFAQQYAIDNYPNLEGFDVKVVITDVDKE